jgi:hypothetical protein
LTAQVLSVLADAEWTQLDLSGCSRLNGAQLLALAHLMPNIRTLDVTGARQCCCLFTSFPLSLSFFFMHLSAVVTHKNAVVVLQLLSQLQRWSEAAVACGSPACIEETH